MQYAGGQEHIDHCSIAILHQNLTRNMQTRVVTCISRLPAVIDWTWRPQVLGPSQFYCITLHCIAFKCIYFISTFLPVLLSMSILRHGSVLERAQLCSQCLLTDSVYRGVTPSFKMQAPSKHTYLMHYRKYNQRPGPVPQYALSLVHSQGCSSLGIWQSLVHRENEDCGVFAQVSLWDIWSSSMDIARPAMSLNGYFNNRVNSGSLES